MAAYSIGTALVFIVRSYIGKVAWGILRQTNGAERFGEAKLWSSLAKYGIPG